MADIVKETLEDGTEYTFDLDVCRNEAYNTLSDLFAKEATVENFDFSAAVFTLFVESIDILQDSGWNAVDLIKEIVDRQYCSCKKPQTQPTETVPENTVIH